MTQKERIRGFTLVETMLAVTIIFIAIAALMSVFQATMATNITTEEQNLAIAAINAEVNRLRAADLSALEAEFDSSFTTPSTFYVSGLINASGSGDALGVITPALPDPPNDSSKLVEFTIMLGYQSGIGAVDDEEVTIWISPDY